MSAALNVGLGRGGCELRGKVCVKFAHFRSGETHEQTHKAKPMYFTGAVNGLNIDVRVLTKTKKMSKIKKNPIVEGNKDAQKSYWMLADDHRIFSHEQIFSADKLVDHQCRSQSFLTVIQLYGKWMNFWKLVSCCWHCGLRVEDQEKKFEI